MPHRVQSVLCRLHRAVRRLSIATMSEGHELGLPTPPLATDAQQQAPPGFENQHSGGEGRPRRRGRPRPRGGARERERREKKERRERQQVT